MTGVTFEIRPEKEATGTSEHAVQINVFQAATSTPNDVLEGKTKSIFYEKEYLYYKVKQTYSSAADANYRAAVSEKRPGLISYLQENYPKYQIVTCTVQKSALKKIGDVDLAFVN